MKGGVYMRDPNRIPRILAAIQATWEKYPNLRLGQLIANALDAATQGHHASVRASAQERDVAVAQQLFFIEDTRLADYLNDYALEQMRKTAQSAMDAAKAVPRCKRCGREKSEHAPPFEYAAMLDDHRHGCVGGYVPDDGSTKP